MGGRSQYYDLYDNDDDYDGDFPRSATLDRENSLIPEKIEDLGRKVTATAEHFFGSSNATSDAYKSAIQGFHKKLKEPRVQQSMFHMARQSQHTLTSTFAISSYLTASGPAVPENLLRDIPEPDPDAPEESYSLFQGFQVSLPDANQDWTAKSSRLLTDVRDRHNRLLTGSKLDAESPKDRLQADERVLKLKLEKIRIQKMMASCEIHEIDRKLAALQERRGQVVDRLGEMEQEEMEFETKLMDVENELDDWAEDEDEVAETTVSDETKLEDSDLEVVDMPGELSNRRFPAHRPSKVGTESQSSVHSRKRRRRSMKRMSVPILHEHLESGSSIREIKTGHDGLTALDFDRPFGLMVTAGLGDSVFVWDLSLGRRIGSLEGHLSSVQCLQIDDTIVATGSTDATIKIWDLSQADHARGRIESENEEDPLFASVEDDQSHSLVPNGLDGCELMTLQAHVAEVTALHVHGSTLVSGSADKTLRQWDLATGRCVQTLDVVWAAAQSSGMSDLWRPSGGSMSRSMMAGGISAAGMGISALDSSASFVGALQFSNYDLASGTADGVVRMWDLRSGQVTANMIGHTGPITGLQFSDHSMVTSSLDKSIRIWDMRTGTIIDAFGYDNPITSMMFNSRRIVAAAGEVVTKVYDKIERIRYDVGVGVGPRGALAGGESYVSSSPITATFGSAQKQRTMMQDGQSSAPSVVQHVRIRDSYLVEGRENGVVGVWSC